MPNYLLTLTICINSSRLEKYNWTYNSYKKKKKDNSPMDGK